MLTRHRLISLLLIAYLVVIIGFMLARNMSITPDRFFVVLLFAAVIIGRGKTFLRDWTPFIALVLAYELMRGFADTAGFRVNIGNLVEFERSLFGFIPTVELQNRFFNPNQIAFWDVAAVIIDFLFFPLPLLVAFYLWLKNKTVYWKFIISLLLLYFAAYITFLLFPAAPPWYASQKAGLIQVYKIIDFVVAQIGWGWDFSQIYNKMNPNPVAAIPSLHSAVPWLAFLVLYSFNKKVAWFFLPYPILVWLSVVYLGEHYVIDVLAGITYASAAYILVYRFGAIKALFKKLIGDISLTDEREEGAVIKEVESK